MLSSEVSYDEDDDKKQVDEVETCNDPIDSIFTTKGRVLFLYCAGLTS